MSRRHSSTAGFTILELVLVVALLAVLFKIGIPSLSGLTPKYRLRTAARQLGSTLEGVRLSALSRGLWMGMRYVITPGPEDASDASYYQVIAPAPADFPEQPVEDRARLSENTFPTGVRIARVVLSSNQIVDQGSVSVLFSPMGNAGSHIVTLAGADNSYLSVKINCITGSIEFIDSGDVAFQHFEE